MFSPVQIAGPFECVACGHLGSTAHQPESLSSGSESGVEVVTEAPTVTSAADDPVFSEARQQTARQVAAIQVQTVRELQGGQ